MGAAPPKHSERRRELPGVRRKQLIDATISCIAHKGIASTTLSDVAREAGLSQGIVNLHFKSKSNLLTETLTWLADRYASNREKALAGCGSSARERLTAIVESDFKPAVFNRRMLAVWYAFLGEAKARPTYQKICKARDREYEKAVLDTVLKLLDETGRDTNDAALLADALCAITDGLWTNCLVAPDRWGRQRSRRVIYTHLASLFPESFSRL